MTEMEFFATYEFRPDVVSPERVLHAQRRNGGKYGDMTLTHEGFTVRVIGADNVERRVGFRRSFAGAFKLLREQLVP
jgi:hypothetical protein